MFHGVQGWIVMEVPGGFLGVVRIVAGFGRGHQCQHALSQEILRSEPVKVFELDGDVSRSRSGKAQVIKTTHRKKKLQDPHSSRSISHPKPFFIQNHFHQKPFFSAFVSVWRRRRGLRPPVGFQQASEPSRTGGSAFHQQRLHHQIWCTSQTPFRCSQCQMELEDERRFQGGRRVVLVPGSVNGIPRSNIDRSMSVESMAADDVHSQSTLSVQELESSDTESLGGVSDVSLTVVRSEAEPDQHVGLHAGWTLWISLPPSPAEQRWCDQFPSSSAEPLGMSWDLPCQRFRARLFFSLDVFSLNTWWCLNRWAQNARSGSLGHVVKFERPTRRAARALARWSRELPTCILASPSFHEKETRSCKGTLGAERKQSANFGRMRSPPFSVRPLGPPLPQTTNLSKQPKLGSKTRTLILS